MFFGAGRAGASLLLAYSGKIKEKTSLFSFLRFRLVFYSLMILILGFVSTWWVVVIVFLVVNSFQWGLSRVSNAYLVDIIKTSKFKATLLSVNSQVNQVIAGVAVFVGGFVIEKFSYQYGFLYLGVMFIGLLVPLYLYIISRHKDLNELTIGAK